MSATFKSTHDPIYSITQQEAPYDVDTRHRGTRTIPPQSNGSAAAGIHKGGTTTFTWAADANHRTNLFSSTLNLVLKFCASEADLTHAPTDCAPPWNIVGRLINKIDLKINDTPVLTMPNDSFLPIYTANLRDNYTLEQLDKNPGIIGPVWSDGDKYIFTGANGTPVTAFVSSKLRVGNTWLGNNATTNLYKRLRVPLCDIIGRVIGLAKNVRKFSLDIQWNTDPTTILEKSALDSAGICLITNVDLTTDDWELSSIQEADDTMEKRAGEVDILPMIVPLYYPRNYDGSDIIINNVPNCQGLMMFGIASDVKNKSDGAMYTSCGQTHVWNMGSSVAATFRSQAFATETSLSVCPTSLQVQYGSSVFNATAIPMQYTSDTAFDISGLHYYANLATGRIGNKITGSVISRDAFGSTMPCIHLKWSPYEAPKRTEARDIIIHMPTVGAIDAACWQGKAHIILFQYKTFIINVDGTVKEQL